MAKRIGLALALTALTIIVIIVVNGNLNKTTLKSDICSVNNCTNQIAKEDLGYGVYSYSEYCEEHTCQIQYCQLEKAPNSMYCYPHTREKQLNEEKNLKLTNQQISEVRKVVDQYCRNLMSKHSNIRGINIINDTPETTENLIMFRCNVVRDDSKTNLATIYVKVQDDGMFKVDELKYDK